MMACRSGRVLLVALLYVALDPAHAERHISVGRTHACTIRASDLAIECSGDGFPGMLQPDGVRVIEGTFHGVSAGANFSCGLWTTHLAACWGLRGVADGSPLGAPAQALEFLDIVAGERHVCGLRPDGGVACFGPDAVQPPAGVTFVSISAGIGITCGVTRPSQASGTGGGSVICWSADSGHPLLSGIPAPVAGSSGFIDVAIGDAHACAMSCGAAGAAIAPPPLACWGGDTSAFAPLLQQLARELQPTTEPAVVYVTAGAGETCVVMSNTTSAGAVQRGAACARSNPPAFVRGSAEVVEISCGGPGCAYAQLSASSGVLTMEPTYAFAPAFRLPKAGAAWTPRESGRLWMSVASSADGLRLAAVVYQGLAYTSSDGGGTWTPRDVVRNWRSVASSADGLRLVALADGLIFVSADGGNTWMPRESSRIWRMAASSADGMRLVAVDSGGLIYTSSDGGVSWTPRESARNWLCVTSSADGLRLLAAVNVGQLFTSSNGGVSWTPRDSSRAWSSVSSSANGTRLVAVVSGGLIYTSFDGGVNWTPRESPRDWSSVSSSADGMRLVAVVSGGLIYTSSDGGVSWTPRESARGWSSVASSADGMRLVAAISGGQLYTSYALPLVTHFAAARAPSGPTAAMMCPRLAAVNSSLLGTADLSGITQPIGAAGMLGWPPQLTRAVLSIDAVAPIIGADMFSGAGRCFSGLRALAARRSLPTMPAAPLLIAPSALVPLTSLAALELSGTGAQTSIGAFALAELPQSQWLANIHLANNGIRALGEAATAPRPAVVATRSIDLSGNSVVNISDVRGALMQLCGAATQGIQLRCSVDLSRNSIRALHSAAFWPGMERIVSLNLTYNGMTLMTADALAATPNAALRALDVTAGNRLAQACFAGLYNGGATIMNDAGTYISWPSCLVCKPGSFCDGTDGLSRFCPAGKISRAAGASSCSTCAAGAYSGAPGLSACTMCEPGYFCDGTDGLRRSCPRGTYASEPAALTCTLCPGGTFNELVMQTTSSACAPCLPGFASNVSGAGSALVCTACMPGYHSASGARACTACAAGWFANGNLPDGSGPCSACERGRYSNVTGATSNSACVQCDNSTTTLEPGATSASSCIGPSCAPGTAVNAATGLCADCPAGRWSAAGATACSDCAVGLYGPSLRASACVPCPVGTYGTRKAANDTNGCAPCPTGTVNTEEGQTRVGCLACEPGTFNAVRGASSWSSCATCAVGTYAALPGQAACTACPAGTWSRGADPASPADCVPCSRGRFSPAVGATSNDTCRACPAGTGTLAAGATLQSDCRSGAFGCAEGMQPRSAVPPVGDDDCVPLRCEAPLVALPSTRSACGGCAPGFAGTLGTPAAAAAAACAPCPADGLCPGFTSRALLNFSAAFFGGDASVLAAAARPVLAASCGISLASGGELGWLADAGIRAKSVAVSGPPPRASGDGIVGALLAVGATIGVLLLSSWLWARAELHRASVAAAQPSAASSCAAGGKRVSLAPGVGAAVPAAVAAAATSGPAAGATATPAHGGANTAPPTSATPAVAAAAAAAAAPAVRRGRVACCVAVLDSLFRAVDLFALKHHVHEGEAPRRRTTPYGGACSAVAAVAVVTFAAVLVARRQLDNVLVQESLSFLGKSAAAGGAVTLGAAGAASSGDDGATGLAAGGVSLAEFTWETAGSITGTELLLPPSSGATVGGSPGAAIGSMGAGAAPVTLPLSGIHVRVLAHGEPGACDAPQWWQADGTGTEPGSATRWRVLQGGVGSGDRAASRLLFACPGCELSATAALRFGLHYSCQSLVLQVGAVSANGSVTLVTAAPKDTAGSAGGGMLLRLDLSVAPVLGTRTVEATDTRTRGYELLPISLTATRTAIAVPALLQPAAAEVVVAIALPLQPLYTVTTLSEKTSLVELVASILALGSLFGIFAHVFAMSEGVLDDGGGHPVVAAVRRCCITRGCSKCCCCYCCRRLCDCGGKGRAQVPGSSLSEAGAAGPGASQGGAHRASAGQLATHASAVQLASRTSFMAVPADLSSVASPALRLQRGMLGGSAGTASAGSMRAGALGRGGFVGGPLSAAALASAASHRSLAVSGGSGAAASLPADGATTLVTVNPLHSAAASPGGVVA